jgi:amidase
MAEQLMFRPVGELAALVRAGEISARELVSESLARIDELDGRVGAFVQLDADGALAAAEQIQPGDPRPYAGVPIAIKNNRAVRGLRLTNCSALLGDFVAPYDHSVVARLRRAGFVIVGTTKLPEFGILPTTEPVAFGPSRNPWDLSRTPGGSSGGSAAAVAAGMVPVAHGNDGGGSLRIPAACCGLVGLKAQRHRTSTAPESGASPLVLDGLLTRSVGETAALLDIVAGYEIGDAAWAPPAAQAFADSAAAAPAPLRIAFTTVPPVPRARIAKSAVDAVTRTASLLESLGHSVEEVTPPWEGPELVELFGSYFGAQVAAGVQQAALARGAERPSPDSVEPLSYALWERAQSLSSVAFQLVQTQLQVRMRALIAFLDPFDVLLTPALAASPLALGALDPAGEAPLATFARSALFTPFTPIFNASGQPALALPLYADADGLPLAVQLVGRPAGEGALLALAAQLEAAAPWHGRRAAVS